MNLRCLSRLGLILGLIWLSGCAVSPAQREQLDRLVEQHPGLVLPGPSAAAEGPALPTPPDDRHGLVLIERGDDALAMRLHLIRSARHSIEIQNYIFLLDDSGQLLLDELLKAAARGVQVRVLVDSLFSLPDENLLAALELAHPLFSLRLFGPVLGQAVLSNAEFIGAVLCCFHELNQRMHNKLMVVDGQHGLIGGRNHSARYFDLDTRMVFVDLEVLVSGPVVQTMRAEFDRFWEHELAVPPRHTRRVMGTLLHSPPQTLTLMRSERLQRFVERLETDAWLQRLLETHYFEVAAVEYFSDLPEDRADRSPAPSADSTAVLHRLIAQARQQIVLQTPYVVLSPRFRRLLGALDADVEIVISSNSLASTDAFPVYAISRKQRAWMLEQLGVQFFEAKPYPADLEELVPRYPALIEERRAGIETPMRGDPGQAVREMPGPRISLHAKLLVIDQRVSVVTSHNFDPRSEIYNTENGIVVEDAAFASALLSYIEPMTAAGNSWASLLHPDRVGPIAAIDRSAGRLSRRLPTLDLWPSYGFEQYRLAVDWSGETPQATVGAEGQEAVGLSPEVISSRRRRVTALVSRMMGFLRPIL